MNNKQLITNRAFTLIEILISTAIFAMVALVANVVVAQSVGYITLLSEVRTTSQDAAKVAESITADFRAANAPITVGSNNFKNGFVSLKCGASPQVISSGDFTLNTGVDTLYFFSKTAGNTFRYSLYKIVGDDLLFGQGNATSGDKPVSEICNIPPSKILSSDNTVAMGSWSGHNKDANILAGTKQSYLNFEIQVKSKDYNKKLDAERAFTSIRSSVTARSLSI
ncbi:MAG: prepilin-type N-terminal cleavage/methylation domain-containing protein [Candidatus Berkelbacteria bacterium]